MSFTCKYCGRDFTSERTINVLMCSQKRRFVDKDLTHVRLAFRTYQKFYEMNMQNAKTKTYDEAVEELSVWYARNLMPTYSLVPEIIKFTRMAPVGNFISWPSEILRLTTTAFRTALREAS